MNEDKFIVVDKKGWHKGVIGIVASRIAEKFYRPTVVIAKDKKLGYGSGRSIDSFNLFKALTHCKKHFESFGGHEKAAGLSIKTKNIDDFRKDILNYAEDTLKPEDLIPTQNINAIVPLSEINERVINEMEKLKPFGLGNPRPVICSTNLHAENVRVLKDKHVKTQLKDGSKKLEAIGFNMGELAPKIANNNGYLHVCYAPQFNTWNGKKSIQLNLKDVKIGKLNKKNWYDKVKEFLGT